MTQHLFASLVVAVLWATACRSDRRHHTTNNADTSLAAADAQLYLDPAEGCGFDSAAVHPDPVTLAREFVARDSAGEFLATSVWFNGATTCPAREPGPDAVAVVAMRTLRELGRWPDSVRFVSEYERLGYVRQDSVGPWFDPAPGMGADTLDLVRSPFGWRVGSPALLQRVGVAAAARRFAGVPRVLKTLDSARTHIPKSGT